MRRRAAAWTCALIALSPLSAAAQTGPEDARADALFKAAQQLQEGGQLVEACPMFAESKRLAPGVGVTLHLADCYERIGKPASAWEQFHEAEQLAHDRGDDKRATIAHERAQALESKVGQLTIAAAAVPHPGWAVALDGVPVPSERWNSALRVNPGEHVVTIDAPGRPPRMLHAQVEPTLAATLPIDETEVPAVVAAAPPTPSDDGKTSPSVPSAGPEPAAAAGNHTRLWVGVGLVGIGVAGLGLGTAWLIKKNDAMNNGTACDPPRDVRAVSAASTIAYAAGGVALASAIVVYLTAPHRDQVSLSVAPVLAATGGGAILRANF